MITLFILLIVAAVLLLMFTGIAALILDPLIAILAIWLLVKIIKKVTGKKTKKK